MLFVKVILIYVIYYINILGEQSSFPIPDWERELELIVQIANGLELIIIIDSYFLIIISPFIIFFLISSTFCLTFSGIKFLLFSS